MADAKVVFLHGLRPEVVDVITSYSTEEFPATVVNGREASEDEIVEAARDADFAYQNIARVWAGEAPQSIAKDYDIE